MSLLRHFKLLSPNDNEATYTESNGKVALDVSSDSTEIIKALLQLKFWEMKGMTIDDIENTYGFDFVTKGDCELVISNGNFVIVRR